MTEQPLYSGSRFRKALRAFLFGRATQGIANFLLTLWVVRLLSPADYGAYMALWGLVEMLAPLSSFGILEATRRFLPELATRGSSTALKIFIIWTTAIRLSVLLFWTVVVVLLWESLTSWLGFVPVQASEGYVAIGLIVSVLGMRYGCEVLEGLLDQRWSQFINALMALGRLSGVGVLLAYGTASLSSVLWVDVVVSVVCLALAEFALAYRIKGLKLAGQYAVSFGEAVHFAWNMAGASVLQATASFGLLRLLAARLLGLDAAGLFAFMQQLVMIVGRYMPAPLLENVIRPMMISRLAAGERGVVSSGIALMWKSNMLILTIGVAAIAVAGDTIISAASGGRFDEVRFPFLVLFVGLAATSQEQLLSLALQIHDRTRHIRAWSLLFPLVPLFAWFGSRWGLIGMLLGIVSVLFIRSNLLLWWMPRLGIHLSLGWRTVGSSLALMVPAVGVGLLVGPNSHPTFAIVATLLLMTCGLVLIKPLCPSDFAVLMRALGSRGWLLARIANR